MVFFLFGIVISYGGYGYKVDINFIVVSRVDLGRVFIVV